MEHLAAPDGLPKEGKAKWYGRQTPCESADDANVVLGS